MRGRKAAWNAVWSSERMAVNTTVEVVMPAMGESVSDGTILEWHKQEGDQVSEDETLVEISTDPPAPRAQRPAQVATHGARRPASQRPSSSRAMHRTDSEAEASSATRRSDHRIGWSSMRRRSSPAS